MNDKVKEAALRMIKEEPGLFVKRIDEYIVVRKGMPKVLAEVVKADLKKHKYRKIKTHRNITIFKRPL